MQEKDEFELNSEASFFEAIRCANIPDIVKFFRDENLKPWDFVYEDEFSGLHRAAFLDQYLVICTMIDEMKIRLGIDSQKQIEKWINLKSKRQGYTALHYASFNGNLDIIEKLLKYKADVEISNNRGLNVLHMAAQGNSPNTLIYFKEKYNMNIQSVDEIFSTPLHWACYSGSESAINFLLSWDINLNYKDKEGITPLHLAVMSERTEIIKKLLQKGANKRVKDNKGRTPYDLAFEKNKNFLLEMLKDKTNCQLFAMKMPLEKLEKNKMNIISFLLLHIFLALLVLIFIIPYCHESQNKFYDSLYLTFLSAIFILYMILLYIDPGRKLKNSQDSFLKLVENRVNIKEYCPACIVKKSNDTRHCLICDICIEEFDHHCSWLNNCVGKKNLYTFWIFLIIVTSNLFLNTAISIEALCFKDAHASMFFVPSVSKYYNLTIITAFTIILVCCIFSFPLIRKGINLIGRKRIPMSFTGSSLGIEEALIDKKDAKSIIIHDVRQKSRN